MSIAHRDRVSSTVRGMARLRDVEEDISRALGADDQEDRAQVEEEAEVQDSMGRIERASRSRRSLHFRSWFSSTTPAPSRVSDAPG